MKNPRKRPTAIEASIRIAILVEGLQSVHGEENGMRSHTKPEQSLSSSSLPPSGNSSLRASTEPWMEPPPSTSESPAMSPLRSVPVAPAKPLPERHSRRPRRKPMPIAEEEWGACQMEGNLPHLKVVAPPAVSGHPQNDCCPAGIESANAEKSEESGISPSMSEQACNQDDDRRSVPRGSPLSVLKSIRNIGSKIW